MGLLDSSSFSDLFSGTSSAFSDKLSSAFSNPMFNLGIGLLSQSGPSRIPIGLGQAFGNAFLFAAKRQEEINKLKEKKAELDRRFKLDERKVTNAEVMDKATIEYRLKKLEADQKTDMARLGISRSTLNETIRHNKAMEGISLKKSGNNLGKYYDTKTKTDIFNEVYDKKKYPNVPDSKRAEMYRMRTQPYSMGLQNSGTPQGMRPGDTISDTMKRLNKEYSPKTEGDIGTLMQQYIPPWMR